MIFNYSLYPGYYRRWKLLQMSNAASCFYIEQIVLLIKKFFISIDIIKNIYFAFICFYKIFYIESIMLNVIIMY